MVPNHTRPGSWWMARHDFPGGDAWGAIGVTPGHPTYLTATQVISFLGGTWKWKWESVPTSPCKHQNIAALKRKVRVEFGKIPEVKVQKWRSRSSSWTWRKGGPHGWGGRPAFWGQEASYGGIKQWNKWNIRKSPAIICNSPACNCDYEI